jgi:hypothetical protein
MNITKKAIDNLITRSKYNDFGGVTYTVVDKSDVYSEIEERVFFNERDLNDYITSNEMRNKKLLTAKKIEYGTLTRIRAELKVFKKRIYSFTRYNDAAKFVKDNYSNLTLEF